jgi:triacylglycerol esterase/lipase EstA (alpha/beta hydrolase family)
VRDQTGAWHVDLVARSMGGLISRQYIDSLMPADPPDGRPVVSHLVMLGTPNEGSPCAQTAIAAEGLLATWPMEQLTTSYLQPLSHHRRVPGAR